MQAAHKFDGYKMWAWHNTFHLQVVRHGTSLFTNPSTSLEVLFTKASVMYLCMWWGQLCCKSPVILVCKRGKFSKESQPQIAACCLSHQVAIFLVVQHDPHTFEWKCSTILHKSPCEWSTRHSFGRVQQERTEFIWKLAFKIAVLYGYCICNRMNDSSPNGRHCELASACGASFILQQCFQLIILSSYLSITVSWASGHRQFYSLVWCTLQCHEHFEKMPKIKNNPRNSERFFHIGHDNPSA